MYQRSWYLIKTDLNYWLSKEIFYFRKRDGIGYDLSRSVLRAENCSWCSYRGASVSKELVD